MKKGILKRLLALAVAALLSVSLFACGSDQSTEPSKTATTGTEEETGVETTAETTEEVLDKSPITLTIGMPSQNCTIGDGIHQEYTVLKEITNQTGVTLDFVTYDANKFKVLAAGGDLPDLISVIEESTDNLIDSGVLLQLDELLEKYGKNILNNIPIGLKWSKQIVGNGKIRIMPVSTGVPELSAPQVNGGHTFNTRYDIYKAIGSPKMSGEDDYLNVLKQMQDYQRKATGNNKVYALSAFNDWGGLWAYFVSYPFAHGFSNTNYNHSLNGLTDEMEHNFLKEDSSFWKSLYFFNKAYRMDIFDPEALTMKYPQYEAKVVNGTVLTQASNWIVPDPKICGESAFMAQLPGAFPITPGVYNSGTFFGMAKQGARAINASCENPERAMQLLNYFDSEDGARMLKNGIKGVDWDVVDGKAKLIGPRLEAIKSGTLKDYEKQNPNGIGGDASIEMSVDLGLFYTSGEFKTSDGEPVDLKRTKEMKAHTATPAQRKFAQEIDPNLTYPGQVYEKWVNEGIAKTTTTSPTPGAAFLIAPISTEAQQTENKAAEYVVANLAKVIMAKDEAAFNSAKAAIINEIKAMGVEASDAEYQKNFEEAKTLAASFME